MSRRINLVSVSGGKDSTAMMLDSIERGYETQQVFADTGNEHEDTYAYLDYLDDKLGVKIQRVKPDFTDQIEAKAAYVRKHWFKGLTSGKQGKWIYQGDRDAGEDIPEMPKPPANVYRPSEENGYKWTRSIPAISADLANDRISLALETLKPTGNPFLDLCIWKGRFPSPKGRFCSEELKSNPITEQVVMPLLRAGHKVRSWQGIRKDESPRRAAMPMHELIDLGVWVYRPLLNWSAEQVFAIHRKHGVKPNPLYLKGMGRVGCMPCVMCRKGELAEISRRFPDVIAKLREWERMVSNASKQATSVFFDVRSHATDKFDSDYRTHGVDAAVDWAKTLRGGKQYDLFADTAEIPACSSNYGLCEMDDLPTDTL